MPRQRQDDAKAREDLFLQAILSGTLTDPEVGDPEVGDSEVNDPEAAELADAIIRHALSN